jgi:hypothetical protein
MMAGMPACYFCIKVFSETDLTEDLKRIDVTLEETIAAKPTAAYDARWGQFVIDPAFFTRLVYAGV